MLRKGQRGVSFPRGRIYHVTEEGTEQCWVRGGEGRVRGEERWGGMCRERGG